MTTPVRTNPRAAMIAALSVLIGVALVRADAGTAASQFSFAFIGDVPYSSGDLSRMPQLTAHIDASGVEFVAHAGDIKPADDKCSDALFAGRFAAFQAFDDAFWYTPGDNEWTDCRESDRDADPLERLDRLRSVFYPDPSRTTGGRPITVSSQDAAGYPENVWFRQECVTFGSIHNVGSSNGLSSWPSETPFERELREAEVADRLAANARWVDVIFDRAEAAASAGVFILTHARPRENSTWGDVTDRIVERTASFDGEVVIGHGDNHNQNVERSFLGVGNLTRWETEGGDGATREWIRAVVDCSSPAIFSQVVVETGSTTGPTTTTTTTTTTSTTTTTTTTTSTTIPVPTSTAGPAPTSTVRPSGPPSTVAVPAPTTTAGLMLDNGATVRGLPERGDPIPIPGPP